MKKLGLLFMMLAAAFVLPAYEVLVLGDTHYDSLDTRKEGMALTETKKKERTRNFDRWEKTMPAMLAAAGKRSEQNIAFAIQLGDMIQGGCGSEELQTKAFRDALTTLKRDIKVPFYMVKGNHDIHGDGAEEAFAKVMLPYLNQELKQPNAVEGSAHYALKFDRDLFIFFDSIEPDTDFVAKALAEHKEARYVFFLSHLPVLPCSSGRPEWLVYGMRSDNPAERKRLLALLAERNAIVLCAHIHRTTLTRYRAPEGTITQLSNFSLPLALDGDVAWREGTGRDFFASEAAKEARKQKKAWAILADFEGKITEHNLYSPGAGYNVLRADDNGVFCDLYFGADAVPTGTLRLASGVE